MALDDSSAWFIAPRADVRTAPRLLQRDASSGNETSVTEIGTGTDLTAVAAGHGAVWVLGALGLYRVEPGNAPKGGPVNTKVGTDASAVISDDDAVWVADAQPGRLSRVNPESGAVTSHAMPDAAGTVGLAAGGGTLWWIDRSAGTVTQVDPDANTPIGDPVRVGSDLGGAAVADGALWVTIPSRDQVVRVRP